MDKEKYFSLTIILRCTKHSKIRKAFSVNHFTAKGTEVAFKFRGAQPAHESCCALNSVNCSIMKIIIIKKNGTIEVTNYRRQVLSDSEVNILGMRVWAGRF
jgi:hypothetical protein